MSVSNFTAQKHSPFGNQSILNYRVIVMSKTLYSHGAADFPFVNGRCHF